MGLLSVLTGREAGAASGARSAPAPEADQTHFVSALLAAFGLGAAPPVAASPAPVESTSAVETEDGLSLDGEACTETCGEGSSGFGDVASRLRLTASMASAARAVAEHGFGGKPVAAVGGAHAGELDALEIDLADDVTAVAPSAHEVARSQAAQEASAQEASAQEAPAQAAPTQVAPIQIAPTQVAPTQVAPPQERPIDVKKVDASLDRVAPALRDKIERVSERMRDEFGHDVTVVEGYRSQERQAHLYAQGRAEPGKVATWTKQSWHSDGLAADLMVDGAYEDRMAYARLQRVAREEGLRTLGSRDRGHVELPLTQLAEAPTEAAPIPGRRWVGVARPAAVAQVAPIARVATPGQWVTVEPAVADTARVQAPTPFVAPTLDPGAVALGEVPGDTVRPAPPTIELTPPTATAAATRADEPSRDERAADAELAALERVDASGREASEQRVEAGADADGWMRFGAEPSATGASPASRVNAAAGLEGPTMAERVEQVEQLRELAQAARPSRVSVRLDGPGSDQIRVGLLNRSVDAELDMADPLSAEMVRSRVAELHRSMEARGLGLDALSVNGVASSTSGREGWLSAGPESAGLDALRTLFTSNADAGRNGQDRDRQPADHRMNHGGTGSDRSRRDQQKKE